MSIVENKNIIRRWVETAWNGGDLDITAALFAPDYRLHSSDRPDVRGPEGLAGFVRAYLAAQPDLRVEIADMIGEGDKVAWRVIMRGTHRGEFMGLPASGKPLEVGAIIFSRFAGGVWVEDWVNSDDLGMLEQMGTIPTNGPRTRGEQENVPANTLQADSATLAHNKAIARAYWEDIFSNGDLAKADEITAADWSIHNPELPPGLRGPEGLKALISSFRSAFPDISFTVDDELAEGDRVAIRCSCTATHLGDFMGIPSTGKHIALTGMGIDRLAGGKLIERWGYFDALGMLTQMGVVPAPAV